MSYSCSDAFGDLTGALVPDYEAEDEESVSEWTDAALAEIERLRAIETAAALFAALFETPGDAVDLEAERADALLTLQQALAGEAVDV